MNYVSLDFFSGELWQPVWDPPHPQLIILQKLLKDEHHRRISKGGKIRPFMQCINCTSISQPIVFLCNFQVYFSTTWRYWEMIMAGAHFCDGRPAVNLAQPAPDDQAATDPKHHRLICWLAGHLRLTWVPGYLSTWVPGAHLWSPAGHHLRWTTLCCEIPVGGGGVSFYQLQRPHLWLNCGE